MSAAQKRLDSLKRLLAHAHERLALDFGFTLWDGSTVPANLPSGALSILIADEGVVAGLIRRPNIETLMNVWVAARLDILNGTMFDLVDRRPKVRTKELRKHIDWPLLLDVIRRFVLVSRGGPWPLDAIPDDTPASGKPAENRQNIKFHYDVSNAFYDTFLDPERGYTCGYFHDWDNDYDQATIQRNKFDHVCRKLRLKPGDRMLDIGFGWSGLLRHAVRNYGVIGHGVTLSEDQLAWAQKHNASVGLSDRITLELRDFSTLEGQFDKISQCEMFEHIGLAAHPLYFQTIQRLLKPDGLYLHQASVRLAKRDHKTFLKKRPEVRALTKYIFPGAEFDHIGLLLTNFERFGFEVHDVEDWREHHARTCRIWHDDLYKNREAAIAEAGLVTTRMWLTWMAGCSIAFERNTAAVYQTLVSKRRRGPSGLPPTRADLYR